MHNILSWHVASYSPLSSKAESNENFQALQVSSSTLSGDSSDTNFCFSFVLFPGCIVCCLPCCSITLIYVLSLLCLSFHTSPSEMPRSSPLCLFTSVDSSNLSFFSPSLFSFKCYSLKPFSLVSTTVYRLKGNEASNLFRPNYLLFKTRFSVPKVPNFCIFLNS